MILIAGRGATYGEVWYDEEPPRDANFDILMHLQRNAPIKNAVCTPFLSLVTDLSVPGQKITEKFSKSCRYMVRRAESQDHLNMEFFLQPAHKLQEFRTFFDAFAKEKSLASADNRWLEAACRSNQLALASVSIDGEILIWHAHVISKNTARLQYSSSHFRGREKEYQALIGRANRWLHWQEMLRFKEMGLTRYDWGGLFDDESRPGNAGVNKFKREFGGQQERTYQCILPVTFRGRIWFALRNCFHARSSKSGRSTFFKRILAS